MMHIVRRAAQTIAVTTTLTAALAAFSPPVHADVLNFDDLSPGAFVGMPADYQGFNFAGWFHSDFEYPDLDPTTAWSAYQPASGSINIFTDFADPADPAAQNVTAGPAIRAAVPFVFVGAHVTGYSPVSFVLTLGGVEVHRSDILPVGAGADGSFGFLSSGYSGLVDAVAVNGVQGYFALDNFSYATAPIPEPSTFALLSTGSIVGFLAWRRQRGPGSTAVTRAL